MSDAGSQAIPLLLSRLSETLAKLDIRLTGKPELPDDLTRATLIHNERTKLLASAVDRGSTTSLTVGVAAPVAGHLFDAAQTLRDWYHLAAMVVFGAIGALLHTLSRHLLGGPR